MNWLYYDTPPQKGATNMAIDEAILDTVPEGSIVFRTYTWKPACLSLGVFQKIESVNRLELEKRSIDLVRRPTGGRAVLHDKELTYSIVVKAPNPILDESILSSYYGLCEGIVEGLRLLGLSAHLKKLDDPELNTASCFAAPTFNDIEVMGKKIVGSAQMRNKNGLLQHGSILIDVDVEEIFAVLTTDNSNYSNLAKRAKTKITSINSEFDGQKIGSIEVREAMVEGFKSKFGVRFDSFIPTSSFYDAKRVLEENKYSSKQWTENR